MPGNRSTSGTAWTGASSAPGTGMSTTFAWANLTTARRFQNQRRAGQSLTTEA